MTGKSNKLPPPSEASLSLIRESRHLVLVLPTNGLDTCINRLLITNRPNFNAIILNMVLIIVLTRVEGKEVEDDLLYSEILAALAAGTKIIPVTADFQVLTHRHWHISISIAKGIQISLHMAHTPT